MIKSGEEILADIDATLDQLILNAEVLRSAPIQTLQEEEVEAMQKTQESLLAHLLHMDRLLSCDKKKQLIQKKTGADIKEKISHFSRLNAKLIDDVAMKFNVKPRRSFKPRKKA
jgi:hypothetical protein